MRFFFLGMHHPADSKHFDMAFVSINTVRGRKSRICPLDTALIIDSGAFTELSTYGAYRHGVEEYAAEINRLKAINPNIVRAVAQDYMCEPFIIAKTGLSVAEHQRLTIQRYDELLALCKDTQIMPVLQGYSVDDYLSHIDQYGERLAPGTWVGVGSVCKRNTDVHQIEAILIAIKRKRPDLRLHGFGIKLTSLSSGVVDELLYSADSMAWSFRARKEGRDQNDHREAKRFLNRLKSQPVQLGWKF